MKRNIILKILIALLFVCCLAASGCGDNAKQSDKKNNEAEATILSFDSYDEMMSAIFKMGNYIGRTEINRETKYITEGTGSLKVSPQGIYNNEYALPFIDFRFVNSGATTNNFLQFDEVKMDIYNCETEVKTILLSFRITDAGGYLSSTKQESYELAANSWTTVSYDIQEYYYTHDLQDVFELNISFTEHKTSKDDKENVFYLDNLRGVNAANVRKPLQEIRVDDKYTNYNAVIADPDTKKFTFDLYELGTYIGIGNDSAGDTDGIKYTMYKNDSAEGEILAPEGTVYEFEAEKIYTLLIHDEKGRADDRLLRFETTTIRDLSEGLDFEDGGIAQNIVPDKEVYAICSCNVIQYSKENLEKPKDGGNRALRVDFKRGASWPAFNINFGKILSSNPTLCFDLFIDKDSASLPIRMEFSNVGEAGYKQFFFNEQDYGKWITVFLPMTQTQEYVNFVRTYFVFANDQNIGGNVYIDNIRLIEAQEVQKIKGKTIDLENEEVGDYLISEVSGNIVSLDGKSRMIVNYGGNEISGPENGGTKGLKIEYGFTGWPGLTLLYGEELLARTKVSFDLYLANNGKYPQWVDGFIYIEGVEYQSNIKFDANTDIGKWINVTFNVDVDGTSDRMFIRFNYDGFEENPNSRAEGTFLYIDNIKVQDASIPERVAAKSSTCSEYGNVEYWMKDGKYYSDALCLTEIQKNELIVEKIAHTPGAEATIETPQICTVCGTVIKPRKPNKLLNSIMEFETENTSDFERNVIGFDNGASIVEYGASEVTAPASNETKGLKVALPFTQGTGCDGYRSYVDIMFGEELPKDTTVSLNMYIGGDGQKPYLQWYELSSSNAIEYAYGYVNRGEWLNFFVKTTSDCDGIRLNIWDSVGQFAYMDNITVLDSTSVKLTNTTLSFENSADKNALIKNIMHQNGALNMYITEYGASEVAAPVDGGEKGVKLIVGATGWPRIKMYYGENLSIGSTITFSMFVVNNGHLPNFAYAHWNEVGETFLGYFGAEDGKIKIGEWVNISYTIVGSASDYFELCFDYGSDANANGAVVYFDNISVSSPVKINNTTASFEEDKAFLDENVLSPNPGINMVLAEYGASEVAAPVDGGEKGIKLTLGAGGWPRIKILYGENLAVGSKITFSMFVVNNGHLPTFAYAHWNEVGETFLGYFGSEDGKIKIGEWVNITYTIVENARDYFELCFDYSNDANANGSVIYFDNIKVSGPVKLSNSPVNFEEVKDELFLNKNILSPNTGLNITLAEYGASEVAAPVDGGEKGIKLTLGAAGWPRIKILYGENLTVGSKITFSMFVVNNGHVPDFAYAHWNEGGETFLGYFGSEDGKIKIGEWVNITYTIVGNARDYFELCFDYGNDANANGSVIYFDDIKIM